MSAGVTSSRSGTFGVIGGPQLGEKQKRELVNDDQLSEKLREGLDAEDFIIYGKASVEKYDEDNPPQKLEMGAFEDTMDSFFKDGLISRRHKDIPVGNALREHTLDSATEVVVGDEVLQFEAGDTLETGVHDDELWIVANLRNDSELARDTRLGAMTGDLNGFSVTVFCKEWEETQKGQRVTDLDWHSVTIGADEQIKNKDSRFGVAEYKMFDMLDGSLGVSQKAAERATVEILRELPTNMDEPETEKSGGSGFWTRVSNIASQKAEEEQDTEDGADYKKDGGSGAEPESEKADGESVDASTDEHPDDDGVEAKGDTDAVLKKVREELGDDEADTLKEAMDGPAPPAGDDEDEPEERPSDEPGELKADPEQFAEKLEEAGFVTEAQLEEKLDERVGDFVTSEDVAAKLDERVPDEVASKSDVEAVMKAAEEVITDTLPEAQKAAAKDAAAETAEKMATGSTPDPTGGSAADEQDYMEQIQNNFGTAGGDN